MARRKGGGVCGSSGETEMGKGKVLVGDCGAYAAYGHDMGATVVVLGCVVWGVVNGQQDE